MLDELVAPFRAFVASLRPGRPVVVLCHNDADGLSAGAILTHALARAGHAVRTELTLKGESAWSPGVAERLAAHAPQALIVADLGCQSAAVLPDVPTLFLDHHRPEGVPPGAVLVTGYGTEPTPTSGLLAFAAGALIADVNDLDWIAAVSLIGDIGDSAPFPLLASAKKRHTATALRDATSLLNAPRRTATGDARPALDLLLTATGPKDITKGDVGEPLRAAKAEVAAALAEAKKAAPRFAGEVALVRVHSPCQVHPMLVPTWKTRLPKNVVIVANTGYLPGRVNFTVRSATGRNLIEFLKAHAPPGAGDQFARGHDQATGGSLTPDAWNAFVGGLGFGPEARVA